MFKSLLEWLYINKPYKIISGGSKMKDKMLFIEEVLNQFGENFVFERKIAENILQKILSNYILEYKNSENSKKDLSEKIELYFECQAISKTINENSEYQYRLKLLKFANYVDKSVDSITTQDVRDFLSKVKQNNVTNDTLTTYIVTLRSFFQFLMEEEYILKTL